MARNKIPTIKLRRKGEGKTNYKKRLNLLKSRKPRLTIRKSNKNLIVQLITYNPQGDKVEAVAHSKELEKLGWKHAKSNIPAAYLLGLLISKKTKVKEAVPDIGFHTPTKGAKVFAAIKGAVDGGIKIPYSQDSLPTTERINGAHIKKDLEKDVEKVKKKIMEGKK